MQSSGLAPTMPLGAVCDAAVGDTSPRTSRERALTGLLPSAEAVRCPRGRRSIQHLPVTGQSSQFLHNSSWLGQQSCRYMDRCSRRSPDQLGGHWHPETADRPADLCGQRAGRWPNRHGRRQGPAYRLGRGFNHRRLSRRNFRPQIHRAVRPGGLIKGMIE